MGLPREDFHPHAVDRGRGRNHGGARLQHVPLGGVKEVEETLPEEGGVKYVGDDNICSQAADLAPALFQEGGGKG